MSTTTNTSVTRAIDQAGDKIGTVAFDPQQTGVASTNVQIVTLADADGNAALDLYTQVQAPRVEALLGDAIELLTEIRWYLSRILDA